MQLIAALMTGEVITVGPTDDVDAARALMQTNDVNAVPVVTEEGRVEGILTTTDLLYEPDDLSSVDAVMSGPVLTATSDVEVATAAALLRDHGIHHLVVVGTEGKLAGILSSWDLLGALAAEVRALTASGVVRPAVQEGDQLYERPLAGGPERRGDVIEVLGKDGEPPWVVQWEGDREASHLRVAKRDDYVLDGCER